MTGARGISQTPELGGERARAGAYVALGAALAAVVVLAISLRTLLFLSVPLAILALVAGVRAATLSRSSTIRLIAWIAVALGVVVIVASVAGVTANTLIGDDYEFYERQRP